MIVLGIFVHPCLHSDPLTIHDNPVHDGASLLVSRENSAKKDPTSDVDVPSEFPGVAPPLNPVLVIVLKVTVELASFYQTLAKVTGVELLD